MKIALLGTGFGRAHAAIYVQRPEVDEVIVFGRTPGKLAKIAGEFGFATSTDLDGLLADGSVDLVDICLPTPLHADIAIRAMQAGKHVLIELPLAATIEDARRIITAHQATSQMAFVDMFSRFSPARRHLHQAVADQRYGPLKVLEIEGRTALLWPGYHLGLDTLALDMMHADFDLVTSLLGQPATVHTAGAAGPAGRGSAAEVILAYPHAFARCASSSLMPVPYGMRGGWRATFSGGVLEYVMRAGFTGQGPATLTEHTSHAEKPIDLPDAGPPCAVMIDHVLACLAGRADNIIEPASALPALELTLDVHQRLSQQAA
jgi:predicted dehydrogenase